MSEQSKIPSFIKGKKVILRPINKETDLESCWRWINDPEIRQFLVHTFPTTKQMEEKWFAREKNNKEVVFGIETLKEKFFIGTMGLHGINFVDHVAETGALIGEKKYWGKGYGTDAKMYLLNYAFNTLNLRKIISGAYSFNERSIAYSKHCGYKTEGVQKKHVFKNGKYHDLILLGLFKEDWLPIWECYQKTGSVK